MIDSLQVENFKSYSGKHVIGPFHDFTCVIGPNGGGKSNAMDAISFVLGVDRKEMRARSASSMVFEVQGQPPPPKATVELSLRPRKGGKSTVFKAVVMKETGNIKYTVDGVAHGKREYHDLLSRKFNIHVTADWTNFLVFQGQVEEIATKNPKQVTEMIEQVSGSKELRGEYDEKKKAWQKAESALAEASGAKRRAGAERGTLKQFQKEAEKYQSLQADLSEMKTLSVLAKLYALELKIVQFAKSLESANDGIEVATAKASSQEDKIKEKKKIAADLHKEVLALTRQERTKQHDLSMRTRGADEVGEGVSSVHKKIEKMKEAIAEAKRQGKEHGQKLRAMEQDMGEQRRILAAHEAEWKAEDKQGGDLSSQDTAEYKRLLHAAEQETVLKAQELKGRQRLVLSLSEQLESQDRARRETNSRVREYETSVKEYSRRIDEIQLRGENVASELKAATTERKTVGTRLAQLRNQETRMDEQLKSLASALSSMRSDRDESRNEEKQRAAIEELKRLYPGVKGPLCDLVSIPDKKYQPAAAVALGRNLDGVVTDNNETALSCVEYLRSQRSVFLNFIPLASVRGKEVGDSLRRICEGSCKPLVDVLKYDDELAPAIRYSVGETLVCNNRKEAEKYAWEHPSGRHKVVTVEGTVMQKNGVVTGGEAAGMKRAQRFNDKMYDQKKEERDKVLAERAALRQDLSKLEQKEDELNALVQSSEGATKFNHEDLAEWEKKKKEAASELSAHRKAEAAAEPRIADLRKQLKAAEEAVRVLEKEIDKVESRVFGDFGKKVDLKKIKDKVRSQAIREKERAEKRAQLLDLISRLEASIDFEKESSSSGKTVDQLEKILKRLEDEQKEKAKDAKKTGNEKHDVEMQLKEIQKKLDNRQKELKKAEDDQKSAVAKLEDLRADVSKEEEGRRMFESALDTMRTEREQLFEKSKMDEVDIPTTKPKPSARGNPSFTVSEAFVSQDQDGSTTGGPRRSKRASTATSPGKDRDMYGIDFSSLPPNYRSAAANNEKKFLELRSELEVKIEDAQGELDKCAPNMKAAEKLSTVDGKLKRAEDDVTAAGQARRDALNSFQKVEEARTKKYLKAFERISREIDPIYKQLTSSLGEDQATGQAYLQGAREEPFLQGTNYNVMPPRKRSRGMHELSGGEKTLAALALLFAIHKASPSPFYVLDEVDAALDRYNTEQLVNYVTRMKGNCQFLVATHKDQFYSASETLVGVHKEPSTNGSGSKTLDLRKYRDDSILDPPAPSKRGAPSSMTTAKRPRTAISSGASSDV